MYVKCFSWSSRIRYLDGGYYSVIYNQNFKCYSLTLCFIYFQSSTQTSKPLQWNVNLSLVLSPVDWAQSEGAASLRRLPLHHHFCHGSQHPLGGRLHQSPAHSERLSAPSVSQRQSHHQKPQTCISGQWGALVPTLSTFFVFFDWAEILSSFSHADLQRLLWSSPGHVWCVAFMRQDRNNITFYRTVKESSPKHLTPHTFSCQVRHFVHISLLWRKASGSF